MKARLSTPSFIIINFTFSLFAFLTFFMCACTRSPGYKQDKDFFEETPDGYYSGKPKSTGSSADKLERLKQPKKKILVLSLWNDTPVGDAALGDFATEELKRELFLSKHVNFPENQAVTSTTKDFVEGDRVQIAQLVREGRRLGVNTVVVGRISKIIFRQDREEVGILREAQNAVAVDVEMKVFDVSSSKEVSSVKRSGASMATTRVVFDDDPNVNKEAKLEVAKEALHDAVMKLVPEVLIAIDKMDWQGRIAKILGNKVYINAGKISGLLPGDILKVISPGEEIVDPVTNVYLGRSEGQLKGTLEVTDFIGDDSSLTYIHTGGNFQEGDVVRLY